MGGICYRKGYEQGRWFELKTLEECIASKKERGEDCKFEKRLLKAWKKLPEKDFNSPPIADCVGVGYPKSKGLRVK